MKARRVASRQPEIAAVLADPGDERAAGLEVHARYGEVELSI
jgi:hypothetical protein